MNKNKFKYISYCEFSIVSDDITPDIITREIQITPDRFFIKGEKSFSKHSKSIIVKPYNLWALKSKTIESTEETIDVHIEYFKRKLIPILDILEIYKNKSQYNLSFYIWIETDNSGIGLDLTDEQLLFLNKISHTIHFSFVPSIEV